MKEQNTIRLNGFLGGAPRIGYSDGKIAIAWLSMATNEKKQLDSGAKVNLTNWHQLVLRNGDAVQAAQYLNKGAQLSVKGILVNRYYRGRDGRRKKITAIMVSALASPAINQTRLFA